MLKRLPRAVRTVLFGISSPIVLSAAFLPPMAWAQTDGQTVQYTDEVRELNIPAQSLTNALRALSAQTGLQIAFPSTLTAGREAPAIRGQVTPRQALDRMLQGSGLEYEFINDRTATLKRSPTGAAQAVQQEASVNRRDLLVEEIYVTARKREETVQDIPIAITAFSAEDMKVSGIRNVSDMEGIVPGLNMSGGGNGVKKDSNPFIRGVGQRETKVTLDPAVGTYIDGIYLARTAGALLDTVGMERVEVLRGPQGTLFGKNVTGGAISFTTVKPHEEPGGSVSVNVGNYGRSDAAAVANIPLVADKLLSRITLSSKNSNGYFTNVEDNTTWGDDNRFTGIGQLRWLPTENLVFDLFTERTRIRESPRPTKCTVARPIDPRSYLLTEPWPGPGAGSEISWNLSHRVVNSDYFYPVPIRGMDLVRTGVLPGSEVINPDANLALTNHPDSYKSLCEAAQSLPDDKFASDMAENNTLLDKGRYWVDTATVGLTATWDIGTLGPLTNTTLKSISSWRRVEQIADEDLDSVAASFILRVQDDFNETTQVSQELQFTGSAFDDRLFFSTGVYYFQEETPQDTLVRTAGIGQAYRNENQGVDPGLVEMKAYEPTKETLETDNETYAWYGQLDFSVTDRLELTAGLRYTHEERWSRYTKAYAKPPSMVLGNPAGVHDLETGPIPGGTSGTQTLLRTDVPGLANISDWQFYGPGEVNELGNYGWGTGAKSTTDKAWTPMVSLKYNFGELLGGDLVQDAMVYLTYSHGFKAGGVTPGSVTEEPPPGSEQAKIEAPLVFEPEEVKNYEVGVKLLALDRRVRANMAVFYTDYTDMQVTSSAQRLGIPIPFIDNVGNSVIRGFEGEFMFLPTANWRIMLNFAYTDADMKEWDARTILLNPFTGEPLNEYVYTARDDEPMPRVPRWQGYVLTDYTFNLPNGGLLTPSIAARYTSEIYHGFDRGSFLYGREQVTADAATFVDARLSYLSADQKLEISLWGKNLTNKQDYMVGAIPLVDTTGVSGQIFGDPRTFGLEMSYRFGGE